jgi:hypothetical protein
MATANVLVCFDDGKTWEGSWTEVAAMLQVHLNQAIGASITSAMTQVALKMRGEERPGATAPAAPSTPAPPPPAAPG